MQIQQVPALKFKLRFPLALKCFLAIASTVSEALSAFLPYSYPFYFLLSKLTSHVVLNQVCDLLWILLWLLGTEEWLPQAGWGQGDGQVWEGVWDSLAMKKRGGGKKACAIFFKCNTTYKYSSLGKREALYREKKYSEKWAPSHLPKWRLICQEAIHRLNYTSLH